MVKFKSYYFNLERLVDDLQKTLEGRDYKEYYPKIIPVHKEYDKVLNAFILEITNVVNENDLELKDVSLKLNYDSLEYNEVLLEVIHEDKTLTNEINVGDVIAMALKCDKAIVSADSNAIVVGNFR